MKVFISVCVLLIVECITGLDPALDGDPRRTFPARRAIDGSRGRKYYMPEEDEDLADVYGFGGQYDPYKDTTDFADIRTNVPGEPGVDYPSYVTIPQTSFQCQREYRGYYADEEAGCQLFHVCDGTFLVSSFLCPIGSIFSQELLTCDWWNKVDCSSTRPYYAVNRDVLPSEVDDDEILRKAYEMTSLQTSHNDVSVPSRSRNSIIETARSVNELQTSPNYYGDYEDEPDVQYKYSSRYNSGNRDQNIDRKSSTGDQRNPKIKVHTIGQDHNDAEDNGRDVRPSYAPTVPTVTTTTRRFYSPTVPTTSARPMLRPGHDLDFESSDHLYSARGKAPEPSTPTPVTKPTIDTTTSVVVEVPPILPNAYQSKTVADQSALHEDTTGKILAQKSDITMDKSQIVSEFSAIEFQSVYSGENYTFQIDIDESPTTKQTPGQTELPSSHIVPPFFYYSNIDQHNAASTSKVLEESNSTSSNQFIINVPATDVIPPLFNEFPNETRKNFVDNRIVLPSEEKKVFSSKITRISPIIQNRKENTSFIDNSISPPSRLFLPPLDDFQLENSTNKVANDAAKRSKQNNGPNGERSRDSTGGESSPFQISLLIKGDKLNNRRQSIKNSIDQNDSAASQGFEIEKLATTTSSDTDDSTDSSAAGDISRAQIINYVVLNKLQGNHPLGSLKSLQHPDHLPRPFSHEPRETTTASAQKPSKLNGSRDHDDLKERKEILRAGAHTFDRAEVQTDSPLKFELPYVSRTIDFKSDGKLKDVEEKKNEDEQDDEVDYDGSTSTETEFIPSIGFSLNTDEERQKYTDAVVHGLLPDFSISSVNATTISSDDDNSSTVSEL